MQIAIDEEGFVFLNLELSHHAYLLSSIKNWKTTIGVNFPIWATWEYTYIACYCLHHCILNKLYLLDRFWAIAGSCSFWMVAPCTAYGSRSVIRWPVSDHLEMPPGQEMKTTGTKMNCLTTVATCFSCINTDKALIKNRVVIYKHRD